VCAILVASGHSQSGSDQNPTRVIKAEIQPPVNIRSTVDLVLADTLVLDRIKGTPVGGLTVDDFVLYENGVGQQISYFSQDQLPLSLLLLVDRGGCLDPFNDQVREAIRAILRGLKPQDRIGLMAFSDHPKLVLGLTSNQSAVADALGRMPKHESFGGHCFNRALTEAAQYLRDSSKSDARRLIVVITAQRTGLCNSGPSARDVSRMLMESSVMVFGILPRTPAQQLESGMYGVATSLRGALRIGSLVNLSRIAQETGGEIFNDPPEELAHSFAELTLHLRTRYTLGFVPSNPRRDGGFRKLKVQLSAPGETRAGKVRIQARRGYFAPREEAVTMNGR
jgi:Ca-activated chloride channel family protein